MVQYADIADSPEDDRIDIIGHQVMVHHQKVGFVVDEDPPEKVERYIAKLEQKFPGIRVTSRGKGPIKHVVYVIVEPPL